MATPNPYFPGLPAGPPSGYLSPAPATPWHTVYDPATGAPADSVPPAIWAKMHPSSPDLGFLNDPNTWAFLGGGDQGGGGGGGGGYDAAAAQAAYQAQVDSVYNNAVNSIRGTGATLQAQYADLAKQQGAQFDATRADLSNLAQQQAGYFNTGAAPAIDFARQNGFDTSGLAAGQAVDQARIADMGNRQQQYLAAMQAVQNRSMADRTALSSALQAAALNTAAVNRQSAMSGGGSGGGGGGGGRSGGGSSSSDILGSGDAGLAADYATRTSQGKTYYRDNLLGNLDSKTQSAVLAAAKKLGGKAPILSNIGNIYDYVSKKVGTSQAKVFASQAHKVQAARNANQTAKKKDNAKLKARGLL